MNTDNADFKDFLLNINKIRYKVPKSIAKCGALWQK